MKKEYSDVWRRPAIQTNGFPKLMVHDDVQSGSINVRNTRLPLWAIISTAINEGWEQVDWGWSPDDHYGFNKVDLSHFLYNLLEQRGEFGRLLLMLADVERRNNAGWWERPYSRNRVTRQLERCLDALKQIKEDTND